MFKNALIAIVCTFVTVAVAALPHPQTRTIQVRSAPVVTIVKSEHSNQGNGTFFWDSETSDGSKAQQSGDIKIIENPLKEEIPVVSGSYSYPSPDGDIITVTYIADENGFQIRQRSVPAVPQA